MYLGEVFAKQEEDFNYEEKLRSNLTADLQIFFNHIET
jgi:hypothetical protein